METMARTLTKAICWQGLGLVVMTLLGYIFTGSMSAGGQLAAISAAISLLTYIAHEKLWARIAWGFVARNQQE
jgi:uncharacterized membrane protein